MVTPGQQRSTLPVPLWFQIVGSVAWQIVGIVLVIVGAIWLLALTRTIVFPALTAGIIAAVATPLVGFMARHRVPRAIGALLTLLLVVALAVGIGYIILNGITSESSSITDALKHASNKVTSWAKDAGISDSAASSAQGHANASTSDLVHTLLRGVKVGVSAIATLGAFVALTALTLFFLLKDGPMLRRSVENVFGAQRDVAHLVIHELVRALRGYFRGVAVVAAFNGIVIGIGAIVLGVPLPGTIAVVTFVGAFIPYLGAWAAGVFAVLLALGGSGPEAASAMALLALVANGPLQQIVQPFAYGAALDLHPVVVLIMTIATGALFGTFGLVLGAPLTSAGVKISRGLRSRRLAPQPT